MLGHFFIYFCKMNIPVNTVANKNIITLDIATWIPKEEDIFQLDLKSFLYKELILKEADYKEALQNYNWDLLQGKVVRVYCSNMAIIPTWAYMLLCPYLQKVSTFFAFASTKEQFTHLFLLHTIDMLPLATYQNQRVVIKGCGDKSINENIYMQLSTKLLPVVRSIAYGEPCSMVPIYKNNIDKKTN